MTTRLLLVDDHRIVLEGLRALLDEQPDMKVVDAVPDGRQAVERVRVAQPDIVLMDLSMPGMNGIEATRQMMADSPELKVICLSVHSEVTFVDAALDAGAAGYLLKDCALEELCRAIRTVEGQRIYISPGVAGDLVQAYRVGALGTRRSTLSCLSDREREVLQLLAEGHTSREIAGRLNISIKTVGSHREHIKEKLGIHSAAGLTKFAIRAGLTTLEF